MRLAAKKWAKRAAAYNRLLAKDVGKAAEYRRRFNNLKFDRNVRP